jgi:hypothetical protein
MIRFLIIPIQVVLFLQCNTFSRTESKSTITESAAICNINEKIFYNEFQDNFFQLRIDTNILLPVRDPDLDKAANKFANQLKEKDSIQYGNSEGPLVRLMREGIRRDFVAENIAKLKYDQNSASNLIAKWKNGSIERNNMINSRYHFFGFGIAYSKKYCYCVLLLTD